jgi:hypothetical protein
MGKHGGGVLAWPVTEQPSTEQQHHIMKKSLGAKTLVYPTPVFVIGTYFYFVRYPVVQLKGPHPKSKLCHFSIKGSIKARNG